MKMVWMVVRWIERKRTSKRANERTGEKAVKRAKEQEECDCGPSKAGERVKVNGKKRVGSTDDSATSGDCKTDDKSVSGRSNGR